LPRRPPAVAGACLRLCGNDPRRAGLVRGDRRAGLSRARACLAGAFDAHYSDAETGAYYLSADDASDLLLRPHATADDAIPNANSLAAGNLLRLAVLAGDDAFRARADRLIE